MKPINLPTSRPGWLVLFLTLIPTFSHAQFGIAYHQSSIPFGAFHYEFFERLRPEIRVSTDTFIEDISLEGVATYDIVNNEDYEFYAGAGIKVNEFSGFVIPVGANVYPLNVKAFGFHMELSPILGESYDILRGSFGIRYRFNRP